eukprot:CAMPEP_0179015152 /NCGR_PEP_ID=MMETSP0796-20121207/2641_1 /TAXON_ID=73915 /ORGANISM="Pyrodinium bahamense, Strain pbaha01" /LENGTH=487 /DNA_ID=CAMNT_0020710771 /DNA_START=32 /DNA_END=1495 /DNA_ORIENTATION=-
MSGDAEAAGQSARRVPGEARIVCLLCAVNFIEHADSAVLSASMISLEEDLNISMLGLSILYAGGGISMSIFGIVWGMLADHVSRKVLLTCTCVGWGLFSLLGAATQSAHMLFVLRWGQQAMLSSMGPLSQSIVADISEPLRRGTLFGRINLGGGLGGLITKPLALAAADITLAHGIRGWRAMLGLVGVLGLVAALLISRFMAEPDREQAPLARTEAEPAKPGRSCGLQCRLFAGLFCIPSFLALLGQGIFGCTAMYAKGFDALYLKRCGHSGAALGTMSLIGGIAGLPAAQLNGAIPDAFARRSPLHGRPCAAQVSVVAGAIAFAIWVLVAPRVGIMALTAIGILEGLVGGWVTPGVKLPILAEIVPPHQRATSMAWLATLEGSLGGIVGPMSVGFLAEQVFGYHGPRSAKDAGEEGSDDSRAALGTALLWCTLLPWMMQAAVFFPILHCTYRRDLCRSQAVYKIASSAEDDDSAPAATEVGKPTGS